MDFINNYFSSLVFTKVDEKQGYTIYGAGIYSGLGGNIARYILAFVPSHLATTNQSRLSNLKWVNLQTREIQSSYRLKKQKWVIERGAPDITLSVVERTDELSKYRADNFPFYVSLLHSPKKKTKYQYNNKITLTAAIETFQLVLDYKKPSPQFDGWYQVPECEDCFQLVG